MRAELERYSAGPRVAELTESVMFWARAACGTKARLNSRSRWPLGGEGRSPRDKSAVRGDEVRGTECQLINLRPS